MTKTLSKVAFVLLVQLLSVHMAHAEIFKVSVTCVPTEQCELFGKCDPLFGKTFDGVLELPVTKSEWVCEDGANYKSSTLKAKIVPRLEFADQKFTSTPIFMQGYMYRDEVGVDCKSFDKYGFKYYANTYMWFFNKAGYQMVSQLEPNSDGERLPVINYIGSSSLRCSIEPQ